MAKVGRLVGLVLPVDSAKKVDFYFSSQNRDSPGRLIPLERAFSCNPSVRVGTGVVKIVKI